MATLLGDRDRALRPGERSMLRSSAVAAGCLVAVGLLGTLAARGWGRVPFSVPSVPWYHSWPYYLFWAPRVDWGWAALALPVAVLAAAFLVVAAFPGRELERPRSRWHWLAGSLVAAFTVDLAVAALAGGPAAWKAPIAYFGEYAPAVGQVGPIPEFLRHFAERVPTLPTFPNQHPPGATILYALVARVWPGLDGAAVATVAIACLGLLVVAGLARDELGAAGERWAVVCWALAPAVVLYSATSADAMWAPALAGAALAAHRGLARRSLPWTLAGGVLLWVGSMLTFAAVLVLPFLAVRAAWLAVAERRRRQVASWAAVTTATVLGLVGLLWLATGYEPVAAVRAVSGAYHGATTTQARVWWVWIFGDLVAFLGILGFPLAAGLLARTWRALRERAWGSFEVATLASLLAGALWGQTKGEVERMWQLLVPFAVVVAVRQLTRWRARPPLVAALLLGQALAIQMLFFTRW